MKLTVNDLTKASENQTNRPWGYLGHDVRNKSKDADQMFLSICNLLGLEYEAMVMLGESKLGRHLGDYFDCYEGQPHNSFIGLAIKSIAETLEESDQLEAMPGKEQIMAKATAYIKHQELLDEVAKLAPKLHALRTARDESGYYDEEGGDDLATLATGILLDVVDLEKGDDSIIRPLVDNTNTLLDHLTVVADACEEDA